MIADAAESTGALASLDSAFAAGTAAAASYIAALPSTLDIAAGEPAGDESGAAAAGRRITASAVGVVGVLVAALLL